MNSAMLIMRDKEIAELKDQLALVTLQNIEIKDSLNHMWLTHVKEINKLLDDKN